MSGSADELSIVLKQAAAGNELALRRLNDSVYDELRQVAQRTMAGERRDHTLQPSALVHEAYFRLIRQRNIPLDHRSKFMAMAAGVMRRILVDHARAKNAQKRGGKQEREQLSLEFVGFDAGNQLDVIAIHEALEHLTVEHSRAGRVVEMRFFAGMDNEEIAQELGVSTKTVQNDWIFAKAWLYRAMDEGAGEVTA